MNTTVYSLRVATLSREHLWETRARQILLFGIGLSALLYAVNISSSIMNVVAEREALRNAEALSASIAALEQEHFQLSDAIRPERAAGFNLVHVVDTYYVTRETRLGYLGVGAR
jgi:hypothetical protein